MAFRSYRFELVLRNSIRWVAGGDQPVTIDGDGVIEAFAWETEAGFAVHVLNYTNPATHRGWLRKFFPIGAQNVRIAKLPPGREVSQVELLRAGKTLPFHMKKETSSRLRFLPSWIMRLQRCIPDGTWIDTSTMNRWILAIADDLTGALEVGVKFSRRGLAARVTTSVLLGSVLKFLCW